LLVDLKEIRRQSCDRIQGFADRSKQRDSRSVFGFALGSLKNTADKRGRLRASSQFFGTNSSELSNAHKNSNEEEFILLDSVK
jgi:hypothetical protein